MLIILIFVSKIILGQIVEFRDQPIDTIEIESSDGYYDTDKNESIGKDFNLIIAFDKKSNKYFISNYIKANYKLSSKTKIENRKEKSIKKFIKRDVDSEHIRQLVTALNKNHYPLTFKNLNQSVEEFTKSTNKESILKVAKKRKTDWHFKKRYSDPIENQIIFNGCQNIDTLNLFLKTEFTERLFPTMVMDYWNSFGIVIKTNKKMHRFFGTYPDSFKQPWFEVISHKKFSVDSIPFKSVLNFNINEQLVKILPNDFLNIGSIKIESLYFAYIVWYLERNGIKY